MLATQTTSLEILQACQTIFGSEIKISNDFLACLQPTGIKTAFRKRALETHPDRAKALGVFAEDLNEDFINVRQAYERLLSFVETQNGMNLKATYFDGFGSQQDGSYQKKSHKTGDKPGRQNQKYHHKKYTPCPDHFYSGSLPKGNLMLGQFLYYSGLISWRTLIDAICWQRRQRPLIGQIATSWGMITYRDVLRILTIRSFDEKFGECALRKGYISTFDLFALVGKQKRLQSPFGEYFIKNGILTPTDLTVITQKQQLHNMTSYRWKS